MRLQKPGQLLLLPFSPQLPGGDSLCPLPPLDPACKDTISAASTLPSVPHREDQAALRISPHTPLPWTSSLLCSVNLKKYNTFTNPLYSYHFNLNFFLFFFYFAVLVLISCSKALIPRNSLFLDFHLTGFSLLAWTIITFSHVLTFYLIGL